MEARTHRMWWLIGIGALLGGLLTTWLAPKVIAWWFDPPAQLGFNCVAPIQWALARLQWAQFGGVLSGAILGLVIYVLWFRRKRTGPVSMPPPPARY